MRFQSFASGSSGNCIYVGSDTTHLLMDVGISRKRTVENLHGLGLELSDVDGIFITHEHSDHVAGLPMIAKQSSMPIYATAGTIRQLLSDPRVAAAVDPERFVTVKADEKVIVKDLAVNPITISHDAAEPVGYRIMYGRQKTCICTDLGCYNEYTEECLKDSDVLLLESNHDVRMLEAGPYPYPLKHRILGEKGHLSNASSGTLLSKILNGHMKGIFLGHLSQENNLPELAFETVRLEITSNSEYHADELPLHVAGRREPTPVLEY